MSMSQFASSKDYWQDRAQKLEVKVQAHRNLLREIVAYARECGHDWLSLHEADALLADGAALKSNRRINRR